MIISASRRTDLPAWYGEWLIRRIRDGWCETRNPFNPAQISRISLDPADVDCFVFWTRYPVTLKPHLAELEERGYPFYFLYTLLDYPKKLEPGLPFLEKRLELFRHVSARLGPARVIWRYDPVLITSALNAEYHIETFSRLASLLKGYTDRVIVSLYDPYPAAGKRLSHLPAEYRPRVDTARETEGPYSAETARLFTSLKKIADSSGMKIQSCAGELPGVTIDPGRCIDPDIILRAGGEKIRYKKDPGQRKECLCSVSRDIGRYDSCSFGCLYCYAVRTAGGALRREYDPDSPSL